MQHKFAEKSCTWLLFVLFLLCCNKEPEELDVINISNTPGRSEDPAIAADSRGYFYVVWEERAPNGILDIYMSEKPPGGDWTQPEYILEPLTPQRQPAIVADNENTLHLVGQYTNAQGWGEVLYTQKPLNGDWTTPEIIGMYGAAAVPDLAVDNADNVHVLWKELVGYWPIFYSKKTKNGGWSMPVEISKGNIFYTMELKIAVDLQGCAHVVWVEAKTDHGPDALVYTTNAVGDTWSYPINLSVDSLLEISGPQVAVDNEGTVHVTWSQDADIFYAFKSPDSDWQTPARVCSTAAISGSPNLAIDENILQLIYSEDENILLYTSKENGDNWEKPREWFVSGHILAAVGIAVSSSGIGVVFQGHPLPSYDNEEIYFYEIPKN